MIPSSVNSTQSAVLEYVDPSVTDPAMAGLGTIDILGNRLMVQKLPLHAAQLLLQPAAKPILQSQPSAPAVAPTAVVRLSNMTTDEDLTDDELYQDLIEDVKDECSNFGNVVSVVVPRGTAGGWSSNDGQGYIFVEYSSSAEALKAKSSLEGRKYAGKVVEVVFYSENSFQNKVCAN